MTLEAKIVTEGFLSRKQGGKLDSRWIRLVDYIKNRKERRDRRKDNPNHVFDYYSTFDHVARDFGLLRWLGFSKHESYFSLYKEYNELLKEIQDFYLKPEEILQQADEKMSDAEINALLLEHWNENQVREMRSLIADKERIVDLEAEIKDLKKEGLGATARINALEGELRVIRLRTSGRDVRDFYKVDESRRAEYQALLSRIKEIYREAVEARDNQTALTRESKVKLHNKRKLVIDENNRIYREVMKTLDASSSDINLESLQQELKLLVKQMDAYWNFKRGEPSSLKKKLTSEQKDQAEELKPKLRCIKIGNK